jgi:hypothetical protein
MELAIKEIESKIKEYKELLKKNKPLDYGEGVVEGLEEALEIVKWSGYKEEHPFIHEFKDEDEVEMFNSTHELIKTFIFKTRNEVVLANAIYLNMNEINGDREFIQMFKFTCRLIGLNSEWS